MRNKLGELYTDDTPRFTAPMKWSIPKNKPEDVAIQLKARHFVTCPCNDTDYVCVEDDCHGCGFFDVVNSTEHTIHCTGIFGEYDQKQLHHHKNRILKCGLKLTDNEEEHRAEEEVK